MIFDILIFLLVIGILVFFHEMGHFLAAKACGIYCPRFSLGMPPRLFGFKIGETDYCVGLLPIGGYVKMAGQEDAPLTEEERETEFGHVPPERWFSNKPVWQRMIVILAGPAMNVVLAVLIYAIVYGFGANVPAQKTETRIGDISPNSAATTAALFEVPDFTTPVDFGGEPDATGLQTGDRIIAMNGETVQDFNDVTAASVLSGGDPVVIDLERTALDGTVTRYVARVKPAPLEGADVPLIGIAPFMAAYVETVFDKSPAQAAGLESGDIIKSLDGRIIDRTTFIQAMQDLPQGQTAAVTVERQGQTLNIDFNPERNGRIKDVAFTPPPEWIGLLNQDEPLTVAYEDNAFLQEAGFAPGDTITTIDGKPASPGLLRALSDQPDAEPVDVAVTRRKGPFGLFGSEDVTVSGVSIEQIEQAVSPFDIFAPPTVAAVTKELEEATGLQRFDEILEINGKPATLLSLAAAQDELAGQALQLRVRKPPVAGGVVRQEETVDVTLPVAEVATIGVGFGEIMTFHRLPPGEVLPASLMQSWRSLKQTVTILKSLVVGRVSADNLGGPLMIFQATTNSAEMGYVWLMDIMALISINLAVFNLLPLPVLDGGHMVFLTLEAIRRKPVNRRIMEWVQQAGVVLILFLILFVTYNDIKRWFTTSILP